MIHANIQSRSTTMPDRAATVSKNNSLHSFTTIEQDKTLLKRCIGQLRYLVKQEKKLYVKDDYSFLLKFLRCSNYDPRAAFSLMKSSYRLKADHRNWYPSPPLQQYEALMSRNIVNMLSDRNSRGYRVIIVKLGNVDVNRCCVPTLSCLSDLWFESAMAEEETQRAGVAVIIDMSGYSWKLFRLCTSSNVRVSSKKLELFPIRNAELHVVNTSALLNATVTIVYPFLSSETKQNVMTHNTSRICKSGPLTTLDIITEIHFHGSNWSLLHKYIGPEILPTEYGGHLSNLDYSRLNDYLYNNEHTLNELFSLGYQ